MDLSFSSLNLQLDGLPPINYNSVIIDNVAMLQSIETLPGFEACAAFTANTVTVTVFREDVDIVPTIVNDTLSNVLLGDDNQMPLVFLVI